MERVYTVFSGRETIAQTLHSGQHERASEQRPLSFRSKHYRLMFSLAAACFEGELKDFGTLTQSFVFKVRLMVEQSETVPHSIQVLESLFRKK